MEILSIILIVYAIKCALEDARKGYRTSKAAYTASADKRFPNAPKHRRIALAAGHDTGYWTAQAFRGFPVARRGFATGWQAGRQTQAQGKAGGQAKSLWRTVEPPPSLDPAPAQRKGDAGEGSPAEPSPVIAGRAAVREMPSEDVDPHKHCNAPGCGCRCHAAAEPEQAGHPAAPEPAGQETTTQGEPAMAATADVTYAGVLEGMQAAKVDGEAQAEHAYRAARDAETATGVANSARQRSWAVADQMQALQVDPETLGAMADYTDALDAAAQAEQNVMELAQSAERAHKRVLEAAQAVEVILKRGHQGLDEAHRNAPVAAADKTFYGEG